MIHWIWLLGAFIAGEAVGLIIAAICTANEPKKPEYKYLRKG